MTKTEAILQLSQEGYSCQNIADIFGSKKNTIYKVLRYWNATKPSDGLDWEQRVYDYLVGLGHDVTHHRGDYHCDFTLAGVEYDVKSASQSSDGKYRFNIWSKKSRKTIKTVNRTDYLLVFKDSGRLCLFPGRHLKPHQQMLTMTSGDSRLVNLTYLQ